MIQPRYIPILTFLFLVLMRQNYGKRAQCGMYFLVKTPRWFACSVNFETHFRLCLPSKTGHFHSILLLYFENKANAPAWRILIWETDFKFLMKRNHLAAAINTLDHMYRQVPCPWYLNCLDLSVSKYCKIKQFKSLFLSKSRIIWLKFLCKSALTHAMVFMLFWFLAVWIA